MQHTFSPFAGGNLYSRSESTGELLHPVVNGHLEVFPKGSTTILKALNRINTALMALADLKDCCENHNNFLSGGAIIPLVGNAEVFPNVGVPSSSSPSAQRGAVITGTRPHILGAFFKTGVGV